MAAKYGVSLSAAAIGIAGYLVCSPAWAQTAVPIKNNDIGGVVTSAERPGSRRLGDRRDPRSAHPLRQDGRHRRSGPLRRPRPAQSQIYGLGARLRPGRFAEGRAEPGKQLDLTAVPAPNDAAAAQYYPAIYWYSMLKIPGADQFGGKSDIPEKAKLSDWLNLMKNNGCIGCHQLGGLATRTMPKGLGEFKSSEEAWARRVQSGQAGPLMVNIIAGRACLRADQIFRRLDRPHRRGRTAARQAAAAAGPRAQCRRHDVGLGRREALSPRRDLDRQAQSDRQRLRPAVRLAGILAPTTFRSSIR